MGNGGYSEAALRRVGWSKAVELVRVTRRDRKKFDCGYGTVGAGNQDFHRLGVSLGGPFGPAHYLKRLGYDPEFQSDR